MDNNMSQSEIPMGLGMALAKNISAMNYFASLPNDKQKQIIEQTHNIRSKQEMQSFVASLTSNQTDGGSQYG